MKILFCKNSFAGPISGADEIAVNYAVELKAAGHETGMLLVHPPASADPFVARLHAAGVPLDALASTTFSASLAAGRQLAIRAMRACSPASKLIRTNSRKLVFDLLQRYHDSCCEYLTHNRPDVIHVMTPDPGAVMLIRAAHASGVPVVYQEVGIPFHPPGFEEVYERFVSVLPLCSRVAVLSPRLAQEMSRAVPQLAPAYVLPLISQVTTNGASHAPRLASAPIRFGFAARLEYLKGPLQLVEGFRIAHLAGANIELKIAGEGSQRRELLQRLRSLGLEKKCDLTGVYSTLKDRSKFMQELDVFVLPSLTEGTPNVIIEAMACGKPIIATAVGGIPDVVSEREGILVPLGDEQALGDAMTRLAKDAGLRQKMGRSAREKYEQLFTPNVVLPLLLELYQHVLEGHSAGNNGRVLANKNEMRAGAATSSTGTRKNWCDIPGWFQWRSAQEEAAAWFPERSCFVEVGTYLGRSLCSLGEVVERSGKTFTVIGIDTCRGSGPEGPREKDYHGAVVAHGAGTFAGALHKNVLDCGYGDAIQLIIADSLAASRLFGDASIDWLHLDARHDCASVKADILAWLPKIKRGGWLSGDDYDEIKWPEVVKAVNDLLPGAKAWSTQQWRWIVA